jgi:DHA3 family macrolide efflux protein-like MFS transporter
VLLGMMGGGLLGMTILGMAGGLVFWIFGAFADSFFMQILNASNQAIWQAKVDPDVQGRVFAVRRLIAQIAAPLAMLLGGFLADRIFEPAMQPGGGWANTFGWLVGTGPGAGMGLLLVISGLLTALVAACGYLIPAIRDAETILPDHAQA